MRSEELPEPRTREEESGDVFCRYGRGRPWLTVEKGQLTEILPRFVHRQNELITFKAMPADGHVIRHDDVEPVAGVALRKDHPVLTVFFASHLPAQYL